MSSRRILHITTFLQGGAGRVVAELACVQRSAGHQVAVACAADEADGFAHYPAWRRLLAEAGVPLLPVPCTFRRSLHHLMGAVDALERSTFVRAGIDIVHAHAAVPALVAQQLGRRVPLLATMHGWNAQKTADHAFTDIAVFNRVPIVTVPSQAASGHLSAAGVDAARLQVVPYGVAPQKPAGLADEDHRRLEEWRARGLMVLACVGSVGDRKRQRLVLDAMAAPALRDRVACAFVGEGPDLASHVSAASALGLARTTAFVGYRANVTDWLSNCDLAVFPSRREGLPIALLEAAALAVCVVASDIGEHREVIRSGESGVLFAADARDALTDALVRATRMPASDRRTLGEAARLVWSEAHQPARMHAAYDRLYARVVNLPGSRAVDALAS